MQTPPNPHDAFFKELMTQPGAAWTFLRERLPPEVVAALADEEPERLPTSYVDEELGSHHCDLLYRVATVTGKIAFVYVLVEHKSRPDPWVAFQLLRYMVRIWHQYIKDNGKLPLPPIVPLVLYHGAESWTVAPDFASLVAPVAGLEALRPNFRYALSDLDTVTGERLSALAVLNAGLLALRQAMRNGGAKELRQILAAELGETGFIVPLLSYILQTFETVDLPTIEHAVSRLTWEDPSIMVSIAARQLMERSRAEGLAQGMAQGEAQGEARGQAKGLAVALTRVAERRFGSLPAHVKARIADADCLALEDWLDRAAIAETLDEVFAPDQQH